MSGKRKREAVIRRATKLFPVLSTTVDRNGREIQFIDLERRPICENDGCTDKATQVHHLTYRRIGGELLSDLKALCPKMSCRSASGKLKVCIYTIPKTRPIN